MPNDRLLTDAEHLRLQAEEMRAIADNMKDPRNKLTALRIAADYDRQAEHAERRSSERPVPRPDAPAPGSRAGGKHRQDSAISTSIRRLRDSVQRLTRARTAAPDSATPHLNSCAGRGVFRTGNNSDMLCWPGDSTGAISWDSPPLRSISKIAPRRTAITKR